MIEKMKSVYIVAAETHRDEFLNDLRDLGVLHISEKHSPDAAVSEKFAGIQRLLLKLKEYTDKKASVPSSLTDEEFEKLYSDTNEMLLRKTELVEKRAQNALESEKIRAWGSFDPNEVKALSGYGLDLHFYRFGKSELKKISADENIKYIRLASVDKLITVAVLGSLGSEYTLSEFSLPEKGLDELTAENTEIDGKIRECDAFLQSSALHLESYSKQLIKAQNDAEFSSVDRTLHEDGGLIWINGYVPAGDYPRFEEAARNNGWAWCSEDASVSDEKVPTKIKYNKLTALVEPVFSLLGTVPGYGEYDISFWFLAFFTLFFAMIIGDAGYGVIFLIAAVVLTLKFKKVNNAILLLYVLSAGTVAWGAVTGTWFGLEGAMRVPFLKALVIPTFANYPEYFGVSVTEAQNGVMKFCFTIGVIQLALACIMNIRKKITLKDLSFIAEIGWLLSVCALYFTVLYLVIGQSINVTAVAVTVGIGFLLVILFGGMSPDKSFLKGLKSGVSDTFTVFLNTISAFGNVMSYIRLFAVGMASLAIAQSFNNMASGFGGAMVIVGAVIMIIGHLLNIVMGFLSVVVHGVRLNLLEFSGQLGMEWSGTAYEPFKKNDKLKK